MIQEKRDDLERFIREQLIGPGGTGYRFLDMRDKDHWPEKIDKPLEYNNELINTVPAAIYSTGILFPVDDSKNLTDETPKPENADGLADDSAPLENGELDPDEDTSNDEDERPEVEVDAQSLNQMYPNTVGLTVCLDKKVVKDNDLEIIVSGRYYSKLLVHDLHEVGVLLEQNASVFRNFLERLPEGDIIRASIQIGAHKGIHFIHYLGTPALVTPIKNRMRELADELRISLGTEGEREYRSLEKFKEKLFNQIRSNVSPASQEGQAIIEKLKAIEDLESTISHITDLVAIYDSREYGIWRSAPFQVIRTMPIPEHAGRKFICSHKDTPDLKDLVLEQYANDRWASLSMNLQFSEHTKGGGDKDKIFLKVQLLNTSTHFRKEDTRNGKSYFSLANEEVNSRCFFGISIEVKSAYLAPYRDPQVPPKEKYNEDEVSRYIYRQFKDYGIGHGCSVTWNKQSGKRSVRTEYIPTQETPDIDPIPKKNLFQLQSSGLYEPAPYFDNAAFLQFKWLSNFSTTTDQELIEGLLSFVDIYKEWALSQKDEQNIEISKQIREGCLKDQERMEKNIRSLLVGADGKEALLCFRLMNAAMFMQLWHADKAKKDKVGAFVNATDFKGFTATFYEEANDNIYASDVPAAWRPFQLAFILLNLDGIFQRQDDPDWKARNEWVDLVWFPTGGGKTEAYLGLIALTIINRRRLHKEKGGGTAVIMRYTLRLLTTQQFQRATLLIMALELIRRWQTYQLGDEPIYIGMYVGRGSLPNNLKTNDHSNDKRGLYEEYVEIDRAQRDGKMFRSRIPITSCPWCGHELKPIRFKEGSTSNVFEYKRILLSCSRPGGKCSFAIPPFGNRTDQGPIPVGLCDEEIYQHPPALLFGTVDKFAQLAHKVSPHHNKRGGDSRRFFGKGNWETERNIGNGYLTPDLIIQDELHLMMGPLGSAVALFESAIDQLCTRTVDGKKIRPKVISSTATTRNTDLQIMALFDRKVNLFPKPGVNCDDSFFAFYKRSASDKEGHDVQYISKRKYMGILPTGRTQMWMQFRLSAILFTHRAMYEIKQLQDNYPTDAHAYSKEMCETFDYYHTVLSYFNSLREVGKTESQINTYLIKEIRRVLTKVLRQGKLMYCLYTYESTFKDGELTGRLSGEKVMAEMEKINKPWIPAQRFAHIVDDHINKGRTPLDFVIATNMISVGLDISRFNTIIMNCMPRNIAEYIQASSRVARDKQGIVITVHHPFRSRDISHYEHFVEFHEKMYSYVEPISITPFTWKALERYLPLYIATIIRHMGGFEDKMAANTPITDHIRKHLTDLLLRYFKERKESLHKLTDIDTSLKQLLDDDNIGNIKKLVDRAINDWNTAYNKANADDADLVFSDKYNTSTSARGQEQLYVEMDAYEGSIHSGLWRVPQSLRVVDPEAVIRIEQK